MERWLSSSDVVGERLRWLGILEKIELVDADLMEAKRDWVHPRDYVRAMWRMLQQDTSCDYVVATGRTTTVRELCYMAFSQVGLNYDAVTRGDLTSQAEVGVLLGALVRRGTSRVGNRP
jgi:GDPmannose 4,6-dehydratase